MIGANTSPHANCDKSTTKVGARDFLGLILILYGLLSVIYCNFIIEV